MSKKQAVFVAVTAWCKIYENYIDLPNPEYRYQYFPVVLMSNARWDGRVGFVGGFVEPGKSNMEQVLAEVEEEAGFTPQNYMIKHIASHENDKISVDMYIYELGNISDLDAVAYLRAAARAPHALSEGSVSWTHMADYGRGKGLPAKLASGNLASFVKEDLELLYKIMSDSRPDGACDMPPLA